MNVSRRMANRILDRARDGGDASLSLVNMALRVTGDLKRGDAPSYFGEKGDRAAQIGGLQPQTHQPSSAA